VSRFRELGREVAGGGNQRSVRGDFFEKGENGGQGRGNLWGAARRRQETKNDGEKFHKFVPGRTLVATPNSLGKARETPHRKQSQRSGQQNG